MSNGIVERALASLGRGFDLTSDFRLRFCKGEERVVQLNETEKRTLVIPGFGPVHNVPADIRCDKGDRSRYQSDILEFSKMSEFFNQKSAVTGKIPSGLFNAMFGFQSNCWANDAAEIKYLGLDGYFIVLFNLHIDRYPLVLSDEVCEAVPSSWDPLALARYVMDTSGYGFLNVRLACFRIRTGERVGLDWHSHFLVMLHHHPPSSSKVDFGHFPSSID